MAGSVDPAAGGAVSRTVAAGLPASGAGFGVPGVAQPTTVTKRKSTDAQTRQQVLMHMERHQLPGDYLLQRAPTGSRFKETRADHPFSRRSMATEIVAQTQLSIEHQRSPHS